LEKLSDEDKETLTLVQAAKKVNQTRGSEGSGTRRDFLLN
jgi:hypothetical protein